MTVRQIVAAWLSAHGYAGLRDRENDCQCEVPDVMECDTCDDHCQPARRVRCRCHYGCEACDDQRWILATDEEGDGQDDGNRVG
jgi:hypothetical protein